MSLETSRGKAAAEAATDAAMRRLKERIFINIRPIGFLYIHRKQKHKIEGSSFLTGNNLLLRNEKMSYDDHYQTFINFFRGVTLHVSH